MMPRSLPVFVSALAALAVGNAHAQDQLVAQALKRIESVEGKVDQLQAGDVATANRHLNDLKYAAKRLNGAYDKTTEHYKNAAARYNALVEKIQALANAGAPTPQPGQPALDLGVLAQLEKEIGHAIQNLGMLNVTHMGDAYRVGSVQKEIADFRARLAALPQDHPAVKPVGERLEHFVKKFETLHAAYRADAASADERLAVMEGLREKYRALEFGPIQPPYEAGQIAAWVQRAQQLREGIEKDTETLNGVKGSGGVHGRTWDGVYRWISLDWVRKLDEAERQVGNYVDGALTDVERNTAWVLETDPNDRGHVANRLLGEGNFDMQMQRLARNLEAVDVALAWDKGLGREDRLEALGALRQKVEGAVEHMKKAAVAALDQVRVPAAASADPKLLAVVEKVLAVEDYGIGDVQRFVINADLQHRDMHTGDVRSGTVSATINVYHYVWDEFQVCTVEKEGDDYWLYYNTVKRFESGGPTTPLNRWLISKRFRSIQILEENVHRDPEPAGTRK